MPRREKLYHFIYKTTCVTSGKYYVGMHSTDNLDDGYLGSGKRLGYSIVKHGREGHVREIIEMCRGREALKLREKQIITDEMRLDQKCLNIAPGGGGGLNDEAHAKKFHTSGWKAMNAKKDHSASAKLNWIRHREKMTSVSLPNLIFGSAAAALPEAIAKKKETFARIGHAQGQKNSQFGTCWVTMDAKPIKIKKEQLDDYLANGYSRGRKMTVISP